MWASLLGTMYLGYAVVPNTSLKDWAKDEAEERLRRRKEGLPVRFGENYAAARAMGKEIADEEE